MKIKAWLFILGGRT